MTTANPASGKEKKNTTTAPVEVKPSAQDAGTTSAVSTEHLAPLADAAVAKVTAWLNASRKSDVKPNPSAERLSAVLSDPNGLDFTVGFVDRVVRTEDQHAAGRALAELGSIMPDTLSTLDKAQIKMGSALAPVIPQIVVPAARQRIRSMVGHMIVDARDKKFGKAVAELTSGGHRLNINLLGEAVLGEAEADNHLEETRRLLARPDVDYVSIKASSIASRISLWGFEGTVDYIVERLTPLYVEAARAPKGSKFINLDMEEYRDLTLTIAVFRRLLSLPETKHLEAGIVLQAYLPDALGAIQELSAFADERVADGGAGIKVRLVKGANLAMETVHAEVADWPVTTCASKQDTGANYKLVLDWTMHPENMRGLRLGVAGHNLFDIAFAHMLSVKRGVTDRVEFEMLQGMATEQAEAVSSDVGQLLLYVPAVRPQEFDVAISYLVRRLEENAASANFMSGIFDLEPGNEIFRREEARFRASLGDLSELLSTNGYTAPLPNHLQDRSAEVEPSSDELAASYADGVLPAFDNEADTDPSLPANQAWAAEAIAVSAQDGWLDAQTAPTIVADAEVDALVTSTRDAAADWAATPATERAAILYRTADLLAARRGHLVSIAAAEVGKAVSQADTEISEAIDFARYYAHYALELEKVDNAAFTPDKVVLVTPPWNFPLAIPAGSTFAALAAGAAVIHKPSKPTPHCSMAILDALWDAGVPREVLRGVYPADRTAGRSLVSHPSVDRVILTGASETAAMFESWRPELKINAETSGKNGMIVTPAADRDLAVADMVYSAFGHAGQKCSAASLGILVGSVYDSERFRRQLVDAAASMIIDWPTNMRADMGPLTELPSDKLQRAMTTLEDGESWLLKPRQLDDTGRLWSPGIKDGVKPGSFFHLTEVFGPVLGLMKAKDLDEAITLQNATDFGLTGGIQSLDPSEVRTWVERIEVGNAYVNRGITGAIVQRQSFGGWKQSSVGLGSKAGGPNYVMLMGSWADDTAAGSSVSPTGSAPVDGYIAELQRRNTLSVADAAWLAAAGRSDNDAWEAEFGTPRDVTGLTAEANIFRYRPAHVVLRISADARPVEVARAVIAAHRTGSPLRVVVDPTVDGKVQDVLAASTRLGVGHTMTTADDDDFAAQLSSRALDDGVGARVRVIGTRNPETLSTLADRPEVCLLNDEVTASGRVELRLWLKEQAVSMTLHRFGNPSTEFHALADEVRRG
ncbi:MAG: bifunctional proline dehydrogenase/L-glutamate gamma-semialdehyde dehydrogenase [Corynebacterium sp.]|uniref:bifunctional proline dehydrogenase/L-glutamate gamma-semialdehyde dehydrogenase n=2 Tax=Corynebacterium sp. TaxID=1720 RepID=UPI00264A2DDE|nr:bifunctional proline dehydrogenase/L-glutamate gamma-semialdehyde dehydrogenase [Corynebacterium sp.]MDN5719344.1 bifunctional proline dehydrogenase/L-glutamate gamma-semialdehyde dehydrogenase [Corynebacterium sp.]